nr:immunoglobulin light chain junction region [Mus musculus]NSL97033.1 immunoglobulin light chain junction region [Mus musculus]NSL97062.1 immunoglobulin light chain junction region [Mus musculus]NSL97097.1 immunoglobulin light chain junction region [Mus musculus]NSL97168.1 immunoglobulin light chain junction region [Mus musculus]
CQQSNEDPRTF